MVARRLALTRGTWSLPSFLRSRCRRGFVVHVDGAPVPPRRRPKSERQYEHRRCLRAPGGPAPHGQARQTAPPACVLSTARPAAPGRALHVAVGIDRSLTYERYARYATAPQSRGTGHQWNVTFFPPWPGVFFHDGGRAHGRQRAWMAEGFWDWTDIARLVVTPGPTACRPTDGQRRGIAFHLLLAPGAFGKFWPATLLSRPPGATPTAASVLFPPGRPFPPHNRQGCAPATNRFANGDGTHRLPPGRPPNLERPSLPRHERGDVCGRERGRGRIGHLISDELAARVGCAGEGLRLNEDRKLPRVQPTRPDCVVRPRPEQGVGALVDRVGVVGGRPLRHPGPA